MKAARSRPQPPFAELLAKDEKAGRGAKIPLRADLVDDLRDGLFGGLQVDLYFLERRLPLPGLQQIPKIHRSNVF